MCAKFTHYVINEINIINVWNFPYNYKDIIITEVCLN